MRQLSLQNPLDVQGFRDWVYALPVDELVRHGWSYSKLIDLWSLPVRVIVDQSAVAFGSGVIYQEVGKNHVEILFLATAPQFRKQGRLEHLLRSLLLDVGQEGEIWLECREDNISAINLYHKCGFSRCGYRKQYYGDGAGAVLMTSRPPQGEGS